MLKRLAVWAVAGAAVVAASASSAMAQVVPPTTTEIVELVTGPYYTAVEDYVPLLVGVLVLAWIVASVIRRTTGNARIR